MNDFPWSGKENGPYYPPPSPQLEERDGGKSEGGSESESAIGCLGCAVSPLALLIFFLLCWSLMFGFSFNDRHFTFGIGCEDGFYVQENE